MPYRLNPGLMPLPATGSSDPVAIALNLHSMTAQLHATYRLMAALLTVRPVVLTDAEFEQLPRDGSRYYFQPISNEEAARLVGAEMHSVRSLVGTTPPMTVQFRSPQARTTQAAAVATAASVDDAVETIRVLNRLRTESEVRVQGHSNSGDTEPEDL